ncbi:hypothetical protein B0H13DRAFT_2571133 [Mycena leptocephala]|nr:hypothetical protein B0H13DRAFT_2571133 [Mycena leptocephala]
MLALTLLFLSTAVLTNATPPRRDLLPPCPAVDRTNKLFIIDGGAPVGGTDPNQRQCGYFLGSKSDLCTYTGPPTGVIRLEDGPENCPFAFGTAPPSQCRFTNNANSPLFDSGNTIGGITTCNYIAAFPNTHNIPAFDNQTLLPIFDRNHPPPPPPPASSCPVTNNINEPLKDDSSVDGGFTTCIYSNESDACTYASDGDFVTGPGSCPSSISASAASAAAAGALAVNAAGAIGSSDTADAGGNRGTPSTKGTFVSKPILIALLTMNTVLVLVVLAMAVIWVMDRRTSAYSKPRGSGPGYKTVASASVPLTHSNDDRYSDGPKRSSYQ